ncbi:MAG: DNA translocase FtsK [Candidatus Andersenbacteria bacterium]
MLNDLFAKLIQGNVPGLRFDFVWREKIPTTVEECQKEMYRLYVKDVDHTPAIAYAQKVLMQWPIEKGYVLYYDISKGCGEEGRRFEWLYYLCSLMMYNFQFSQALFKEPRQRSYFSRVLKIIGLEHRRNQIKTACQEAVDQEALLHQIKGIWSDRRRPLLPPEPDPLLGKAREFVRKTGTCDPGVLRYNVGMYAIGYNRAVNLVDALEDEGTISPEDNPTWRKQ